MQFCYFFLFILDAVDGILSSGAPTLDDDGDKGDGGDSQQRNGAYKRQGRAGTGLNTGNRGNRRFPSVLVSRDTRCLSFGWRSGTRDEFFSAGAVINQYFLFG